MTVASGDLIGGGMDDVEKGVEALWHDWRRDPARKYPQCIKPQLYTKVAHNVEEGQISPIYGAAHRWFTAVLEKPAVKIGRAHVELQSLMRISYAVFCLTNKKSQNATR